MEKQPFEVRLKATTSLFRAFLSFGAINFVNVYLLKIAILNKPGFVCKHSVSLLPAHHRIRGEAIECAYLIHIIGMNGHLAKGSSSNATGSETARKKQILRMDSLIPVQP